MKGIMRILLLSVVLCLTGLCASAIGLISNGSAPRIESKPSMPDRDKLSMDIGFYLGGSAPGDPLPSDTVREVLNAVSPFADELRFYASSGELAKAYPMAHGMGFDVIGSAWLCGQENQDKAEMDALIEHCKKGYVHLACVGSETLLRGDLTADELLEDLEYVRSALEGYDIPVTTADTVNMLLANPAIAEACDVLFVNCYPFWDGIGEAEAGDYFKKRIDQIRSAYPGHEVMISETGYPAPDSGQNGTAAADFFDEIYAWSIKTGTKVCFFEAVDEAWKRRDEGAVGAQWGFLTGELKLKPCYRNSPVFQGQ